MVVGFLLFGLIGWIISSIQEAIVTVHEGSKELKKVKEKWKGRVVDRNKTLVERNGDIISRHLNKISDGYQRAYYIENSVRDCIQDISEAEGNLAMSPNYAYLSRWRRKATPEYLKLSETIEKMFEVKRSQLQIEQKLQKEVEIENRAVSLKDKYSDLINQFNEIVERKVSLVDDYGEENWEVLPKEIDNLIYKIAKKEGYSEDDLKAWKKSGWSIPDEYKKLSTSIDASFKNFHKREQGKPRLNIDVSEMKGIDFESYLMGLLKVNGFTEIRGTPATGDQGADLIAKRDGKTIIIQAKRYEGAVGNKAVQEVVAALGFYGGDEGWVVTNSTFTRSAKELAQRTGVRLIDGRDLSRFSELFV